MTEQAAAVPDPWISALISSHPADRASVRSATCAAVTAWLVFLALAPFARIPLPAHPIFIPVVQVTLVFSDLVTALLLFAQVHVTRSRSLLALAGGYTFTSVMATAHLLSFPGVFSPTGLLGGNAQTTGYLHVFWHGGFALSLIVYALLRRREQAAGPPDTVSIRRTVSIVFAAAALLIAFTTIGSAWLPQMLDGNTYSSTFNIGRYGQWVLIAAGIAAMSRVRGRTALDVWLLVVLANSFIEIALVAIFNGGRYDVGFYVGRIFALLAACFVLAAMLFEQAKLYARLLAAQETARSERQLRESREVLRRALLAGGMGAWSAEIHGQRVWWSVELEEAAGFAAGMFPGTRAACAQHVHPDDVAHVRRACRQAIARRTDMVFECRFRTASGEWRWMSGRGRPEFNAAGRPTKLFGSVMDVTERRRGEIAAHELEASLRNVADHLPVLAWTATPDGAVNWYNAGWYEYTGMSRTREPSKAWESFVAPSELTHVVTRRQECLRTGQAFEMVVRWRGADGKLRPFLSRCVAVRDGDGTIMRWFGTSTDISEQHATQTALRIAERRKDRFLATVVQELRTPLAPIRHALELLGRVPALPSDAARLRAVIDRQSLQLARLVDDLSDAARIAAGTLALRKERTSVVDSLTDALDAVRPGFETAGHKLLLLPGGEDLQLMADPARLRQVFVPLLNTAAGSTARGGRISARVLREDSDVLVSVRGTGRGGEAGRLDRVFDLFSGTGERERGIGLALARAIVAAHGGTISIVSAGPGGATEITVALPLESAGTSAEIHILDENERA
jgi:PAS domain S-box-containing protein